MTMHHQKITSEHRDPAWDSQLLTNRRAQIYARFVVSVLNTKIRCSVDKHLFTIQALRLCCIQT